MSDGEAFNCTPFRGDLSARTYTGGRMDFLIAIYALYYICSILMWSVFYWGKFRKRYERLHIRKMVSVNIALLALLLVAQSG